MRAIILGAEGQLGRTLVDVLDKDFDVVGLGRKEVDITKDKMVEDAVLRYNPDVMINAAAFVDVDGAESKRDIAYRINAEAVGRLALICSRKKIRLFHYSTDYVFDGEKNTPYIEEDATKPINVYGQSKVDGELIIKWVSPRYVIFRVSGLYSKYDCRGKNGVKFIDKVIKMAEEKGEIKLVEDEYCSPTYAKDVARQTAVMLKKENYNGVFHCVNLGGCSWKEFAERAFKIKKIKVNVIPVSSSEWKAAAKRPKYSVLENKKLKNLGINVMRSWQDALEDYLN